MPKTTKIRWSIHTTESMIQVYVPGLDTVQSQRHWHQL